MEKRDSFILQELILTLLLLFFVIQLMTEVLPIDGLYLIYALAAGGCLSWFLRNRRNKITKVIVTSGAFVVLAWLIYSILNSSLSYTEVITLSVKGVFILEVVLVLASCVPPFASYIQALSVPLFMSHPIFIKDSYAEIFWMLSLGYFITWLAIAKVKFYEFFKPKEGSQIEPFRSGWPAAVFFIVIVIFSRMLFSAFPLSRIDRWGFFQEEKDFLGDRKTEEDYYDLQDKIQKAAAKLIPELDSTAKKQDALFMLSSLITESSHTARTDKAEVDLISLLKEPGPGLEPEKGEALDFDMKNYVDKKITLNLRESKDKMRDILKRQPIDMMGRISALGRINKMLYSNSNSQVNKYKNEIESIIRSAPSLDAGAKTELEESVERIGELRTIQIYRRKLESFAKGIDKLDDKLKEEFSGLSLEIRRLDDVGDFKEMDERLGELKKAAPYEQTDFIKELEGISELRLEAVLSGGAGDLKGRGLPELKSYHSGKNIKGRIRNILKDSALSDTQKEEFMNKLARLESSRNSDALNSDVKRMQDYIEALRDKGLIFQKDRNELAKEIEQVKSAVESRFGAGQDDPGLTPEVEKSDTSEKKIVSIRIEPDYLRLPLGENGELAAIGVYNDNSQEEITETAQWRSSNIGTADVSAGKISSIAMGEAKIYSRYQDIESAPAFVIVEQPKLISIILSPQHSQVSMLDTLFLKAEGNFSDSSRRDITSLVDWELDKQNIIGIQEGKVRPRMFGETKVYAAYSGIRSLPANIKVIVPWGFLIAAGICFSALVLIIMFSALYFITEIKKRKLKLYIENNPKEFIIKLYENMKHILAIFNLSYENHIPPLSYAASVGCRYSAEEGLFFRFTVRFEEAQYSRHILQRNDAAMALDDYNKLLEMFFGHQKHISLYRKYCLALFRRIPLFIF